MSRFRGKNGIGALLKSSYSKIRFSFIGCSEGDPLSPPWGEAAHGVHPVTPSFFRVFSSTV
jgi:hypothetical protein